MKRLLLLLALSACGSGGGGAPDPLSTKPADVSLSISSGSILVGDRVRVKSDLSDIHPNGIVLKWRIPKSMVRVTNTEFLTLPKNQTIELAPFLDTEKGNYRYIIYIFPKLTFDNERSAKIEFQLRGTKPVDDALIELDVDIYDTTKAENKQFDIKNPMFGALVIKGLDINKR